MARHRQHNSPHQITKHHRRCVSNQGKSISGNIVLLERRYHEAWHLLTENMHPEDIARELSRLIDPDWQLVAVRR